MSLVGSRLEETYSFIYVITRDRFKLDLLTNSIY